MRRPGWILVTMTVGAIILAVVGLISLGAYFLLKERDSSVPPWENPLSSIDSGDVDPALALASLGGVPDGEVVAQALQKARPETAFATLAYSPSLDDRERTGDLLLLANRYMRNKQNERAILCYRMAATIATLSPDLPDTVRTDTFLQAGQGLVELGEVSLAELYLDQAYTVATYSPYLQAAYRRTVFEQLHRAYLSIDRRDKARSSLEQSAEPNPDVMTPEDPPVIPVGAPPPISDEIQAAEAVRWSAAQQLSAQIIMHGGNVSQTHLQALAQALVEEDALKLPFYEQQMAGAKQVSARIAVTEARIEWLAIKYRVARRGFGISIVPQWEAEAETIRAELTKAYESLFILYGDLIVAMPDASQIDRATVEALRREILAGRLGRFPNYPEQQRMSQLMEATRELIVSRPYKELRVDIVKIDEAEEFQLVDDETFLKRHP